MGSVSDDKYLRDIVVSFLLAGRDTVASGLTVFFYLMAQYPDAEARILEESDRALGQGSKKIPTLEEIRKMNYLQGAIYETLRLYPPVQMDSKFAKNHDVLPDGTHVKKGTRVSYHPYAMGRMESIWGSDCLEFRPERWLNDDGLFVPVSPYKYPVFQAGVRVCLGKDMGLLAMKVVAVTLLRRFHIRLADSNWAPQFIPGLTATLKGGMPVVVTERFV
ncbi:Cytochrome P450 94C1 [Bienertia sinuspersici]